MDDGALHAILDGVGELLSDLCASPEACEGADSEAGAHFFRSAMDSQASRFWASYAALKQRMDNQNLSVAVLALAKSGGL
jgi:hypothetical protein